MQVTRSKLRDKAKRTVALLLTFTAGFVDIVGYIMVYHFFVAHMTGTTVHLGNKLTTGDWADAAKSGVTIASFVTGSVVGRSVIEIGSRRHVRRVATFTLLTEAILVLAFIVSRPLLSKPSQPMPLGAVCILLVLLAGAMGLQTATLTRIGPLTIHTTFVTGMLNKLAQSISKWLFWVIDSLRQHTNLGHAISTSWGNTDFRTASFMAAIWVSYVIGSVAGTWMNSILSISALYLPVLILVICAAIDQVQPLSLEEEKDQS